MINAILDTGPLVGALDADDQRHAWAAKEFANVRQPAPAPHRAQRAREKIFALVERGVVRIVPILPDESSAVRVFLSRHSERMDYADACLVRLSELNRKHTVVTTDAEDFRIYRRFGRQALPLRVP